MNAVQRRWSNLLQIWDWLEERSPSILVASRGDAASRLRSLDVFVLRAVLGGAPDVPIADPHSSAKSLKGSSQMSGESEHSLPVGWALATRNGSSKGGPPGLWPHHPEVNLFR